jgi:hypothetical protein
MLKKPSNIEYTTAVIRWWLHMRLHNCYDTCDEYNQLWAEYKQIHEAWMEN